MQSGHETTEYRQREERRRTLLCSGLSLEIEQAASAVMLAGETLEKRFRRLASGTENEAAANSFQVLEDSALRLARIAENLNDLLASRQDGLTVYPQPVELAWQYGRIIEQCRKSGKLAGAELEWECALPQGVYVQADPLWADKVLLNLLSNALRCGGRVEVRLAREAEGLLLTVRDKGPGLGALAREHLFEPFVCEGARCGAGLGLCLTREFCRALEWSLQLESDAEGTLVKVGIPIKPPGGGPALRSARRDLAFCAAQDQRVAMELSSF